MSLNALQTLAEQTEGDIEAVAVQCVQDAVTTLANPLVTLAMAQIVDMIGGPDYADSLTAADKTAIATAVTDAG